MSALEKYTSSLFTNLFHTLWNIATRFVINYGGTGSGKSFSTAQKEVIIAANRPLKTLVIRKVGSTLRDSVIPSFRARISELDLHDQFAFNKTDRILTHKENGSQIIFRGLDDPEKLKSFEGLHRILIEEASELDFEDFAELNRRARGVEDIQITLSFNPIHEDHWLKKHFFDQNLPDTEIVHSTYKDNPHLTEIDRQQIEQMRLYDHNQYRIYALGEWGLRTNDAPWLFAFNRDKHIAADVPFLPSYPVYLSFDFNRQPLTCVAIQMSPHKGKRDSFVHIIREFAVEHQLSELCQQIRAIYPFSILYVTGDASGSRGDIGFDQKHSTYYQMIRSYLRLSPKQLALNSRNLQHHDSRLLINTLFAEYPNISISKEHCPKLINDCIIARIDDNSPRPGTLRKDRNIYKMDLFDAMRYFFQTYFKEYAERVVLGKIRSG